MKLLYVGSTLLTLMFASGCGKCTVGVYGKLYAVSQSPKHRATGILREHHVKWYAELFGDMCRSETRRVGDDGISHEGRLISHLYFVSGIQQ